MMCIYSQTKDKKKTKKKINELLYVKRENVFLCHHSQVMQMYYSRDYLAMQYFN